MANTRLGTGKSITGRDFLNQRAEAVIFLSHLSNNCVDRRTVRETDASAKPVRQQFFGDTAGDAVRVALQQSFALADVTKFLARWQLTSAIDRQAELIGGRP